MKTSRQKRPILAEWEIEWIFALLSTINTAPGDALILRLWLAGNTQKQIAKHFEISQERARQRLNRVIHRFALVNDNPLFVFKP